MKGGRGAALVMALFLALGAGITLGANMWKKDLRVARVYAEGNRIVTEREILTLAAIPKDEKLFAVDLFAARRRVEGNQFIRSASVKREAPDGIRIAVVERTPIAALVLDRILYVDEEGYVLPPVKSEEIFDLPVLTGDLPAAECTPGHRVTGTNIREALEILSVARNVGDELYHLISEVHLEGGKDIVLFTAESGVPVVFGHGDAVIKMVTFDGFWKQIVMQRGATELKTVDLRYTDQVVVRWQNDDDAVVQ